jgi:hypothetical protein
VGPSSLRSNLVLHKSARDTTPFAGIFWPPVMDAQRRTATGKAAQRFSFIPPRVSDFLIKRTAERKPNMKTLSFEGFLATNCKLQSRQDLTHHSPNLVLDKSARDTTPFVESFVPVMKFAAPAAAEPRQLLSWDIHGAQRQGNGRALL